MIKKCEHINCDKAGICKCPKDRTLLSYWKFCKDHAAEYNKNWNYYAGMSQEDIEKEWEKDTFGIPEKNNRSDYQEMVGDFLSGKEKIPSKRKVVIPQNIMAAFKTLELETFSKWQDIQKRYRTLAKLEHPDTNKTKDHSKFIKISSAYQTLKKYFDK